MTSREHNDIITERKKQLTNLPLPQDNCGEPVQTSTHKSITIHSLIS